MELSETLERLKAVAKASAPEGMAKFGIRPSHSVVYGVSIPEIRKLGRHLRKNHPLALQLWASDVHEAHILASLVADPRQMTGETMDAWAARFDSWDVCDQVCNNLFVKCVGAQEKVVEWALREEEFVRRAAFALIASLANYDKRASDAAFERFLPIIVAASTDERNFVKKAVNWALRGIGKRNMALCAKAIETATEIQKLPSKAARWNAADALRELQSENIQARLRSKGTKQ